MNQSGPALSSETFGVDGSSVTKKGRGGAGWTVLSCLMSTEPTGGLKERFERAIKLRDENDLEGALAILLGLAEDYPQIPAVHGMLGHIYRKLHQHSEAAKSFGKATQLSPNSELASLGLFHSLKQLGDEDGALSEMKRFLGHSQSHEYDLILEELESSSEWHN
jgi:predicted Zn-dependent protease